jgi:hypothetical protein
LVIPSFLILRLQVLLPIFLSFRVLCPLASGALAKEA